MAYDYKTEGERRGGNGFVIRTELFGIIIAIIVQTLTAVWWGATVTSDLRYLKNDVGELKAQMSVSINDRYRSVDAVKDFGLIIDRIEKNEMRIIRLEQIAFEKSKHI